jgi:hypothetical protein
MTQSDRVYLGLVLIWLLIDLAFFLTPSDAIPGTQAIDASRLLLDAGLASIGWVALRCARRSGFAPLWSSGRSVYRHVAVPVVTGLLLGGSMVVVDLFASIGDIHADFPISLLNYFVGGLFSEVMFRLIPIGLAVWFLANKILGKDRQETVFWVVALLAGLYEPVVSWQIVTDPEGPIHVESQGAAAAFVLVAYVLNVLAAYFFWARGFLAALALRWSFYLIWHVAWPVFVY